MIILRFNAPFSLVTATIFFSFKNGVDELMHSFGKGSIPRFICFNAVCVYIDKDTFKIDLKYF